MNYDLFYKINVVRKFVIFVLNPNPNPSAIKILNLKILDY